jgi:hypothetical protein
MMGRILVATVMLLAVACGSSKDQGPPTGTLEQLLAPIAHYPDPLLAQILMSAQDSAKVV